MKYNMNIKERDEIIFGNYNADAYKYGGARDFTGMDVATLKKLVELGYADPEECQNSSPRIEDFIEFMEANDGYVVNGYTITDERSDYRVSIEAIEKVGSITDMDEAEIFSDFAHYADDFDIRGYAWWD